MTRNFKAAKAFTLIEMLVVLATLVIPAALLLPVLGRARASARRTARIGNLRQISLGIRMYTDDSNDTSPEVRTNYNNARDVVSYVDGHVSYIKMYWDANNATVGHQEAWHYDPPAGCDYKWSGD